jgi:hypothetical protein
MRRVSTLVVLATAAMSVVTTQPAIAAATNAYLVEFAAGTNADAEAAGLQALGAVVTNVYRDVFSGVAITASPTVIEEVRADPAVIEAYLGGVE